MSLASNLARSLDPTILFREVVGVPDPWQSSVLRSEGNRILLNTSRQSGKSTVAACVSLHTALHSPGSLVLLISPSLRQSSELFKKVTGFFHKLGGAGSEEAEQESVLSLTLKNGSRLIALPGNEATVRGFSAVDLICLDEAARCSDELYHACRPFLATTNGRMIAMSTPFGKRGFFWRAWSEGEGYERFEVPASKVSRIDKDWLAAERKEIGEWSFAQEFGCEFLDPTTSLFASEMIENAMSDEVRPLWS